MARRSKPLLIAPLIPLLGVAGIFAVDALQGSRFLKAFVVFWCLLAAALLGYIAVQVTRAWRGR